MKRTVLRQLLIGNIIGNNKMSRYIFLKIHSNILTKRRSIAFWDGCQKSMMATPMENIISGPFLTLRIEIFK